MAASIVVIEDNPAHLELVMYLLRSRGHRPQSAADGEAGIEAVLHHAPRLVLCDILLPVLDGFQVAMRLRAHPQCRGLSLLAMTAMDVDQMKERILGAGFEGVLAKPIDPSTFGSEVESYLAGSKSQN